MHQIKGLE